MPIRRVAAVLLDEIAPFELGVVCEVFGTDRRADGFPYYEFTTCSVDGAAVRTKSGFVIQPQADLSALADADLIAVPAHPVGVALPASVATQLRAAVDRGANVLSLCSGAFLLGEAGLLDGRECTTHWKYADALAARFPKAKVHPDALYIEDGPVASSAGTAAGIDLCLHIVRREHGSEIATRLARRMVVPPHREGGQVQYVETPLPRTPDAPTLAPLLTWMIENLRAPLTIEELAARARMSPRTFARRFRAETGTTPYDWLTAQRVLLARHLLEETTLSVESVATRVGFGDAATLRHHFTRRVGATPQSYRATFCAA